MKADLFEDGTKTSESRCLKRYIGASPCPAELHFHCSGFLVILLNSQALCQSKQRPAIAWMLPKIVPVNLLGLLHSAGCQKNRPQGLTACSSDTYDFFASDSRLQTVLGAPSLVLSPSARTCSLKYNPYYVFGRACGDSEIPARSSWPPVRKTGQILKI